MHRLPTDSERKTIAGRQYHKCNNKPGSALRGLEGFQCNHWLREGDNKGCFDESGYEIDHIIEWSLTHDGNMDNLQALCTGCHKVKTKRFLREKKQQITKNYQFNESIFIKNLREEIIKIDINDYLSEKDVRKQYKILYLRHHNKSINIIKPLYNKCCAELEKNISNYKLYEKYIYESNVNKLSKLKQFKENILKLKIMKEAWDRIIAEKEEDQFQKKMNDKEIYDIKLQLMRIKYESSQEISEMQKNYRKEKNNRFFNTFN